MYSKSIVQVDLAGSSIFWLQVRHARQTTPTQRAQGKLRGTLSLTSVPFVHKLFDRRLDRLQLEM